MNRRGFIRGLFSALAAPAVVRAELLMPISALHVPTVKFSWSDYSEIATITGVDGGLLPRNWAARDFYELAEMAAVMRRAIVPRIVAQIERVPPVPSGFTLAGVPLYMDQPVNKL